MINPVVISYSNNSQVTTVDHGQPISLEVHPVYKAGQLGSHQGLKFGITISKDKIQISSNLPEQGIADQEVRDAVLQVGDGVFDGSRDSQAPGHEISIDNSPHSPISSSCLALLEKELDDFQQLLSSMATPTSPFAPSALSSSGSSRAVSPFFYSSTMLQLFTLYVCFVPVLKESWLRVLQEIVLQCVVKIVTSVGKYIVTGFYTFVSYSLDKRMSHSCCVVCLQ